jgi:hypothetical protein
LLSGRALAFYPARTTTPTAANALDDLLAVVIQGADEDPPLQAIEAAPLLLFLRYTDVVHSVARPFAVGRGGAVGITALARLPLVSFFPAAVGRCPRFPTLRFLRSWPFLSSGKNLKDARFRAGLTQAEREELAKQQLEKDKARLRGEFEAAGGTSEEWPGFWQRNRDRLLLERMEANRASVAHPSSYARGDGHSGTSFVTRRV